MVRSDDWLYRAGWVLVRGVARLLWRLEVVGAERVPLEGGLILAPNHLSLLDPPLIGCACPRELRFIAKAELFRYGLFTKLIRRLGAFPVERGTADVGAIKTALGFLNEGRAVIIFIEGTRGDGTRLLPPTPGVTLLARQSGAAVTPTAIVGTDKAWPKGAKFPRRAQIKVAFGEPLRYQDIFGDRHDRAARDEFSELIMERIEALTQVLGRPIPRSSRAAVPAQTLSDPAPHRTV
ncbi:MAG: 1-acyl-sn-glycerol-3-phosphate acyltransferase [Fimbriimonadales bacterium]|nr:1-acyl-sn-glycerol-3-phosphate acyltransferase [Fimbriimonadales bacterium]